MAAAKYTKSMDNIASTTIHLLVNEGDCTAPEETPEEGRKDNPARITLLDKDGHHMDMVGIFSETLERDV